MASIADYLAQGRFGNILGAAQQFQQLAANKQAMELNKQQSELRQQQLSNQISQQEQEQIAKLDATQKAEAQKKLNALAFTANQAKDEAQLSKIVSNFGFEPDPILSDASIPFEAKKASVLSKASDYLKYIGGSGDTAQIKNYEAYSKLSPDAKKEFSAANRAEPGLTSNRAGDKIFLTDKKGEIVKTIDVQLPPEKKPENIKKIKAAEAEATLSADKQKGQSAALGLLQSKDSQKDLLTQNFSDARAKTNNLTTGFLGNVLSNWGGTDANDLREIVSTIKSNMSLDKLIELKKAGGTLGALSDAENKKLETAIGSLEQSQTKEQFLKNLNRVEVQYNKSIKSIEDEYRRTYKKDWRSDAGKPAPGKEFTSSGGIKFTVE
jgi:hypothetical protein